MQGPSAHNTNASLDDAYWRAVYHVLLPRRTLWIRFTMVENHAPLFTGFGESWMIITAWNPSSRLLSDHENAARTRALRDELAGRHVRAFPAVNSDEVGDSAEPGFAVIGVDLAFAARLGNTFGQRAVVFGDGPQTGLLFPATERWDVRPAWVVSRRSPTNLRGSDRTRAWDRLRVSTLHRRSKS